MSELNGHSNGQTATLNGGLGDASPFNRTSVSASMRLMQRVVLHAETIANEHVEKMIAFAESVKNDPKMSARDRLRATELIATLMGKGIDVAMYLDKNRRIDDGQPTELVEKRVFRVEFDRRG